MVPEILFFCHTFLEDYLRLLLFLQTVKQELLFLVIKTVMPNQHKTQLLQLWKLTLIFFSP